jgi:hypothetical protein
MARRLTDADRAELERLLKSCMLTLDFLAERANFPGAVISAGRAGIKQAYDAGDLRGLRMAERDFTELSAALTMEDRQELEARIRLLAGHDRDDIRRQERNRVRQALRRRRIVSEEEYRAAISRLDEIADDPRFATEAGQLESMIVAYGTRR